MGLIFMDIILAESQSTLSRPSLLDPKFSEPVYFM